MKKIILVLALSLFTLTGCEVMGGGVIVQTGYIAEPVLAPVHGRRGYYNYYYYPDAELYFDTRRNLYFYLDSGSNWSYSANLPVYLRHNLQSNYVEIEMEDARPYRRHQYYKNKYRKHDSRYTRKLEAKGKHEKRYRKYDGDDEDEGGRHKRRRKHERD